MTTKTTYPELLANNVKLVRSFLKASDRWSALCFDLRMEQVKGIENGPAHKAWSKGRVPSKKSKGFAYSAGSQLATFAGLPRPETLDDLRALVA
jgi:hypothetical protein